MGFFDELWESIFIPGTTPVLVLATNIAFALLQFVLILMLFATNSIHFIALNMLSGGLWAATRWFIKEVEDLKKAEEEAKKEAEGVENSEKAQQSLGLVEDKKVI